MPLQLLIMPPSKETLAIVKKLVELANKKFYHKSNNMKKEFTTSSQINSIDYDEETLTLTVEFKTGTYEYYNVPVEAAEEAFSHELESIGKWVNQKLKGKFEYKKIA